MMPNRKLGPADALDPEQCWEAVTHKDRRDDGAFFFGVITTGVYCRPSCPSRAPLRKNVRFYLTPEEAERDGLRACLRCKPRAAGNTDPGVARIRGLCDVIRSQIDEAQPLTLRELSRRAGLSPFHLQRQFKALTGVTPRQFAEAHRLQALKYELRSQQPVTDAIYAAGFSSSSRVYERLDTSLGMTPAEYRAGGKGVSISYVAVRSPLGMMMVGATDRGLCSLQFGESRAQLLAMLRREYPAAAIEEMKRPYPAHFRLWMKSLLRHLRGQQPRLDLPVNVRATAFQLKVWTYLQSIPYGAVESYSEVARAIGHPKAARAVARACASNRVAVVIPCHRVIRGNGGLGGYRWGLARKRLLIDRERRKRGATDPAAAKLSAKR
jgi:AraC family transcriptional regulator, regulatory protein of adaptative response / methylated-DNA-[protein]-cysteine methyltransferase